MQTNWYGKPYYSLDAYFKNTYHYKCYKTALNAHMTCPNRDGTLGLRGCIFCGEGGSGDFAVDTAGKDMDTQLEEGIALLGRKLSREALLQSAPCIVAYFQAYTNTYGPVDYLEQIFSGALSHPLVCGISIATRPDCLPEEVLSLLSRLRRRFPGKFIWIELGLQTIHEDTARFIRRGYELPCFEEAVHRLNALSLPVIVHVILGLPGEDAGRMLETVDYLSRLHPFGVKLQLLHVLKHTDLAESYARGDFDTLTREQYLDILIQCLEHLAPDIVIHRVTGDGPKKLLLAPGWSGSKRSVLNELHRLMRQRGCVQGDLSRNGENYVTGPIDTL